MVYINNEQNPYIYKQPIVKATSNQASFRRNNLQEFIHSQHLINNELKNASTQVNTLVHETKTEHKQHFDQITEQLQYQTERTTPLIENISKQEQAYKLLLERLESIELFNEKLLRKYEDEGIVNQVIVDQLTLQDTEVKMLSKRLEQFGEQHTNLSDQLMEQNEINDQILKTVEIQEAFHKTILERIDQQEAINLKTSRELDNLKATLFERISFVIEKIEENYRNVSNYISHFFSKPKITQGKTSDSEKTQKETIANK